MNIIFLPFFLLFCLQTTAMEDHNSPPWAIDESHQAMQDERSLPFVVVTDWNALIMGSEHAPKADEASKVKKRDGKRTRKLHTWVELYRQESPFVILHINPEANGKKRQRRVAQWQKKNSEQSCFAKEKLAASLLGQSDVILARRLRDYLHSIHSAVSQEDKFGRPEKIREKLAIVSPLRKLKIVLSIVKTYPERLLHPDFYFPILSGGIEKLPLYTARFQEKANKHAKIVEIIKDIGQLYAYKQNRRSLFKSDIEAFNYLCNCFGVEEQCFDIQNTRFDSNNQCIRIQKKLNAITL